MSVKDNGFYTIIGRDERRTVTGLQAIQDFGRAATKVIAVGTCAADGGISAARPNVSVSVKLALVLERPVIRLPGCPCNPGWFFGTLAHLLLFGEPELEDLSATRASF